MRLLLYIIIPVVLTVVASGECENPDLECIELCCEETQLYNEDLEECEDIPEHAHISWDTLLHDNNTISENISDTMELVEYGECEAEDNSTELIPFCYSPYYHNKSKQFVLKQFSDVPCDRLEETVYTWAIHGLVCFFVVPFCLPIMMVYTCRKGLNGDFIFKPVFWYYMSMVEFCSAFLTAPYFTDVYEEYIDTLVNFLYTASSQWLNVIAYQVWTGFKQTNPQNNSDKDRRRFICYSIYVWGISVAITTLESLVLRWPWDIFNSDWVMLAPPCFNFVIFLGMSVNICMIRCGVANHTNEPQFKRQLLCIIFRLSLIMGIPRMLFILSHPFFDSDEIFGVVLVVEPFVIFIVLVLKPKNCCKFNFLCCCCGKPEEISGATEVVYLNTNRV